MSTLNVEFVDLNDSKTHYSTLVNTRADWLSTLFSVEPGDQSTFQSSLRELYTAAGLPVPKYFFWVDSPLEAAWAVALIKARRDVLWQRIADAVSRNKRECDFMERLRAKICDRAQLDWESLLAVAGEPIDSSLAAFDRMLLPGRSIQAAVTVARMTLYDNVADAARIYDDKDDLHRAEHHLRGVLSGQAGFSTMNSLLIGSFSWRYSFSWMAMDEAACRERRRPPILEAAWRAARSAGSWWPFSSSVVVSDRPSEIHVNERSVLHRGDGPAVTYRDGSRLWAWNGQPMREEWITHPQNISPRELKQFDYTFREYVARRFGEPQSQTTAKIKHSSILSRELPRSSDERIRLLRYFNNGHLPFLDSYLSGKREKVWQELVALGALVREDPYAADALAVAYEAMRRVELNVRSVCEKLAEMGYKARALQMHEPPDRKTYKQIERLENKAGTLPLSLRAFYDVVGAIDWIGEHPSIAPGNDSVAPDPLVVFSVKDALDQCKAGFAEDQPAIAIAPDDLHKGNTSGGDPYEILVPELSVDGKLLNERHNLYFVEYLRLVFRFGGFPGYDGIDPSPPELVQLAEGLIAF